MADRNDARGGYGRAAIENGKNGILTEMMNGYQSGYIAGMRFLLKHVIKTGADQYLDDLMINNDIEEEGSLHMALLRETLERFGEYLTDSAEEAIDEVAEDILDELAATEVRDD